MMRSSNMSPDAGMQLPLERRVRDEVRDGLAVAAASVSASVALVLAAALLMKLAG